MVTINLTSFLRLGKPTREEKYDVQVQNTNMDIIDATIKKVQDSLSNFVNKETLDNHINDTTNPHKVTKEQIGLGEVVNKQQIYGIAGNVTDGGILVFDGNGYTVRDSGFSIDDLDMSVQESVQEKLDEVFTRISTEEIQELF